MSHVPCSMSHVPCPMSHVPCSKTQTYRTNSFCHFLEMFGRKGAIRSGNFVSSPMTQLRHLSVFWIWYVYLCRYVLMFVIDILDIDIVFCCIIIYRVELPHFFCFSKLCASMELWSDELVDTADSFLLSSSWKEDPYSNIVRVIYHMIWFVWKIMCGIIICSVCLCDSLFVSYGEKD